MRIRKPFAGFFIVLCIVSAYLGLVPEERLPRKIPKQYHSDKVLHFITFFLITLTFYWIFEVTRRRALNLSVLVCTILLGVGSEAVQMVLPNNRQFDLYDIAFNAGGSLAAIGICAWYHRRMLDRKRAAKGYRPSLGGDEELGLGADDVELGTGPQETGTTDTAAAGGQKKGKTMDEELDQWDENADDDWDEEPSSAAADRQNKSAVS